jgi:hypothetical protein
VDHKIQVKFDYGGIDIYLSMMNCIPQLNVPTIVTGYDGNTLVMKEC